MKSLKIIIVLSLTCILSAAVLSLASKVTEIKIEQNKKSEINKAIFAVVKDATKVESVAGNMEIYKTFDKNNNPNGYAFIAQGDGYQGKIIILCGVDLELKEILGIEIIESLETPGLGGKINEPEFKEQFKGLVLSKDITYGKTLDKENNQIQAITGATISSRSVVNIVNKAIVGLKQTLNK